jgi:hypothetical protein
MVNVNTSRNQSGCIVQSAPGTRQGDELRRGIPQRRDKTGVLLLLRISDVRAL